MHEDNEASVELRDLSCRYQHNTVVEGLNLTIRKGEFFTLLGPSGCGKTTTLRTIAGFSFPSDGSVHISGTDYTFAPANVRPVNYVFQNYALFPHMSVVKNVGYGLRRRGVGRREAMDRAFEELARVRMDSFANRLPGQLSGGQQQRVALARALVNRPDVLLLDEPLSAIDSQLRLRLRGELTRLQRETGTTFIFVTHDQVEALSMSDRIGLMGGGRIVQLATPQQIYQRPNSREAAEFIGNSAILEGTLASAGPGRWRFTTAHGESLVLSDEVVQASGRAASEIRCLTVKPEDITLRSMNGGSGEGLRATVTTTQYQGGDVAIEVELRGGQRIIVTEGRSAVGDALSRFREGTSVLLSFEEPARITLL